MFSRSAICRTIKLIHKTEKSRRREEVHVGNEWIVIICSLSHEKRAPIFAGTGKRRLDDQLKNYIFKLQQPPETFYGRHYFPLFLCRLFFSAPWPISSRNFSDKFSRAKFLMKLQSRFRYHFSTNIYEETFKFNVFAARNSHQYQLVTDITLSKFSSYMCGISW